MNFTQRYQSNTNWLGELDRFFGSNRGDASRSHPRESIHEAPDAWVLRVDLPGFTKEDIALKVTGPSLQLTGETPTDRPFAGKVDRQWKIGNRIDSSHINARLENGVLEITLPKTEAPEPINIEIL